MEWHGMWAYSDGSIRGTLNCLSVISLGFDNDSKKTEISIDVRSTDHSRVTMRNEDQYLAVTAERKGQSTASYLISYLQPPVRQFQGKTSTDLWDLISSFALEIFGEILKSVIVHVNGSQNVEVK
ncbi:hypothetical protein TNCV_4412171 [Trichonephila clavipes]|nr:hypothetical protein TNCV_4412171 [Trichonephila clavipes]